MAVERVGFERQAVARVRVDTFDIHLPDAYHLSAASFSSASASILSLKQVQARRHMAIRDVISAVVAVAVMRPVPDTTLVVAVVLVRRGASSGGPTRRW